MILPAQGRVALHGLIYRLQGQLTATLPGESAPRPITGLAPIPHSLCQQFVLNVDVVEGSEILFAWTDASNIPHRATIGFEFKGEAGPRDDSLTGVLLRAHGGASSREIKNHLSAIKDGHQLPPSELSVRETGKPISIWEVHQQDPKQGWWPILVSEGQELREQKLRPHPAGYFFTSATLTLNEQANAWRSVAESPSPIRPAPGRSSCLRNRQDKGNRGTRTAVQVGTRGIHRGSQHSSQSSHRPRGQRPPEGLRGSLRPPPSSY